MNKKLKKSLKFKKNLLAELKRRVEVLS